MRIMAAILGVLTLAACSSATEPSSTFPDGTSVPAKSETVQPAAAATSSGSDDSAPATQDAGTDAAPAADDTSTGPVPEQQFPGGPMVDPDAGSVPVQQFPGGPMVDPDAGFSTQSAETNG